MIELVKLFISAFRTMGKKLCILVLIIASGSGAFAWGGLNESAFFIVIGLGVSWISISYFLWLFWEDVLKSINMPQWVASIITGGWFSRKIEHAEHNIIWLAWYLCRLVYFLPVGFYLGVLYLVVISLVNSVRWLCAKRSGKVTSGKR